MKKIKLFLRETIAKITGDKVEELALKNYRTAVAAVNQQLGALRLRQIKEETTLETAVEALDNAKFPKERINDPEGYVRAIRQANKAVTEAREQLDDTEYTIVFFESLIEEFDRDVEGLGSPSEQGPPASFHFRPNLVYTTDTPSPQPARASER
jgi:hypothetical protein